MINIAFDLCFSKFKDEIKNITFHSGINVIYGESGVGKSSFLLNLNNPEMDHIFNFNISNIKYSGKLYHIFQNPDHQLLGRTVLDELSFTGECNGLPVDELKHIVDLSIQKLPNTICTNVNPGILSGGEKEILNIITSLQINPDVLLIDDSLSFLSKQNKKTVVKWLKEWSLNNDSTVIWVTSEKNDFIFGDYTWELCLNSFEKVDEYKKQSYLPIKIPKGNLKLEINELNYKYDISREIYSGLSISIKECRSLGIIGSNGSGKSTLASICYRYLSPNDGSLNLSVNDNIDLNIGYIDQFPEHMIQLNTLGEFLKSVIDNKIMDPIIIHTFKNRLLRFGINWDKIENLRGVDLPWSVLRTILIVCLTHSKYDILILDEPTAGLGWNQRLALRAYLQKCMINLHLIIVSHDKDFINSLCDSVINLDKLNSSSLKKIEYEKA